MNIHLLVHNFLYIFTAVLCIVFILIIFFKAKRSVERTTLILAFLGAIIFVVSHAVGVSVTDGELSRRILMFNLINLFLPVFTTHSIFAFLGKLKEQKYVIILSYVVSTSLRVFFLIYPHNFLVTSIPKMYFPNYYVPGPYYFVMLINFFVLVLYAFYIMRKTFIVSNSIDKNRIKYFAFAMLLAYFFGPIDFLLIYNIRLDPLLGFLFVPMFSIPFTYAIIKYDLMDIRVVAKKAFVYILTSAIIGFILILLNYVNNLIIRNYPEFPSWVSSVVLAFITSTGLLLVWRKIREVDFLKYEFIDIINHKFRTPLTAIKWSSESLMESVPENLKIEISHIQKSTNSLVDLTNLLANLSVADEKTFDYNFIKLNLNNLIENLVSETSEKIKAKGIILQTLFSSTIFILADEQKIKFVFQTLLDNAISYTKQAGKVSLEIYVSSKENVILKISDTGIGISEDEIKHIFTKFYRTESGKKADTVGMGIGLYLTKIIVEKHYGKIWVKSEGLGKGSSFFVSLPICNE
jgi:signal transduction histidine kinase